MRIRSSPRGYAAAVVALVALALASRAGTLLVVERSVTRPDAVLSLSSHEWERLPVTARLAAANPSAAVLLTLPQEVTPFNCHDCSGRVGFLKRLGISEPRVHILPLTSPGTRGEALAALTFARQFHLRRLIIVTTPYHTRRALAAFQSVFKGTNVEIGIEPAATSSPARPARWWMTPYDRAYVAYEWAAIVYYALRYHIASW